MGITRLAMAAAFIGVLAIPQRAPAQTEVGGGGGAATDCLTTFKADVTFPTLNPRHVRCTDGDACDADGLVNGYCTIPVRVCANSTFSGSCTKNGVSTATVDHALDNGDLKFDPDFQALQARIDNDIMLPSTTADSCTNASNIRVPIKGPLGASNNCGRGKTKKLKLTTVSLPINGHVYTDVDVMRLQCDPNPVNGCDPQTLWAGTFDRIQNQIFNQNCALSGCHDSQSQQAGLLLETGASFANLVNMDPVTVSAFNDGWKRVHITVQDVSGDLATSFLVHKIEDSSTYPLPDLTYGARMPLNRPKLHATLRNVIEQWILNGAPMTGWVPGTF